jgi:manganese/zinc/iron transport system permease protein
MTLTQIEIQLIGAIVAMACAIPGVFLVLRKKAMLSDAISHSVLPGIVLVFFFVRDLSSPLLLIGAAATGVLTVILTEILEKTNLMKEDAAIGLVFPVLFSIGVILITRNFGNIHLDTDVVLIGELAFAPFHRLVVFGVDIGPKSLYSMGSILILNLLFVVLFFKELKITTFDPALARILGFSPKIIRYILMTLVSLTIVSAFDAVGSVLVVAFIIAIPAAAYLLTDHLKIMILLSCILGALTSMGGFWLARGLNASISGSMAVFAGIIFASAYLLSPRYGWVVSTIRRRTRKKEFNLMTLAIHILRHEGEEKFENEASIEHMVHEFRWKKAQADQIMEMALKRQLMKNEEGIIRLTEKGYDYAKDAWHAIYK